MPSVGSYSNPQPATLDVIEEALYFKNAIEKRLKKKYSIFLAVSYQVQIVAGLNRRIRISVDDDSFVLATIYESLDGKKSLTDARVEHPCV